MPASNEITVLRLGHRMDRDKRITSHLGLTARAFGASSIVLAGDNDASAFETWESVTTRFGGNFSWRHEKNPIRWLRNISDNNEAIIVHLTMYGENWRDSNKELDNSKPLVVVVGGTKVPAEVFDISDYNISVGNQPHSEVAALAVFLENRIGIIDEINHFQGAELKIIPSSNQKIVKNIDD